MNVFLLLPFEPISFTCTCFEHRPCFSSCTAPNQPITIHNSTTIASRLAYLFLHSSPLDLILPWIVQSYSRGSANVPCYLLGHKDAYCTRQTPCSLMHPFSTNRPWSPNACQQAGTFLPKISVTCWGIWTLN